MPCTTLGARLFPNSIMYAFNKQDIVRWQFIAMNWSVIFCDVCFPCPELDCMSFFIWHACRRRFRRDFIALRWFPEVLVYFLSVFQCVVSHSHSAHDLAQLWVIFKSVTIFKKDWAVYRILSHDAFVQSSERNSLWHYWWQLTKVARKNDRDSTVQYVPFSQFAQFFIQIFHVCIW